MEDGVVVGLQQDRPGDLAFDPSGDCAAGVPAGLKTGVLHDLLEIIADLDGLLGEGEAGDSVARRRVEAGGFFDGLFNAGDKGLAEFWGKDILHFFLLLSVA